MKREYIKPQIKAVELGYCTPLAGSAKLTSSDNDDRLEEIIIDTDGANKADDSWEIF